MTARELVAVFPVIADDPLREIKGKIEELKDLGYPIAGLPGGVGRGYRWIDNPKDPEQARVVAAVVADLKGRIRAIARHLGKYELATATRLQLALDFDGERAEGA